MTFARETMPEQSLVSKPQPIPPGGRKAKPGEVAELREIGLACPQCLQHHIRPSGLWMCVGHNAEGKPCGFGPIEGGVVCARRHGGAAPRTIAGAQKRIRFANAEGEAARLMQEMDIEAQHPLDGLLEVVRHAGAMMRVYHQMVAGLDLDPGSTWVEEHGPGGALKEVRRAEREALLGYNAAGEQVNDVRVVQYERWASLYMRACKTALDADIDERLVRNATATSNGFFRALSSALDAAQLGPEQRAAFTESMARELRKMGPGMLEA